MDLAMTIFGAMIYNKIIDENVGQHIQMCRDYFISHVPTNIFKNEYSVFYEIIKKRKDILTLSEESLSIILERNRGIIAQTTDKVAFEEFKAMLAEGDTNDEVDMFLSACMVKHSELCEMVVPFDEFKDALTTYIENFKIEAVVKAIPTMQDILFTPLKRKYRMYQGYEGAKQFIYEELTKIDNVAISSDSTQRGYFVVDESEFKRDTDTDTAQKKKIVCDFGLEPLDEAYGGIYSNTMVALHAPAKNCKSRYTAERAWSACVNFKTDVCAIVLEGSIDDWKALIRARHFQHFYNRESLVYPDLDSDHIKKGEYSSPEYRQLEMTSYYDFSTNPNYGRLSFIEKSLTAENIIPELELAYKTRPFGMLVIDYLGLLPGYKMSQTEVLAKIFPRLLKLQKTLNFATILPNQFSQETVRDLFAEKKKDNRTIAGGSYESVKTPDINIGLYSTPEELEMGLVQFFHMLSREGKFFAPFYTQNNLGVCEFSTRQEV